MILDNLGIPYNESAKIQAIVDIKLMEEERRVKEAIYIFNDMRDFFQSEKNVKFLETMVSRDDILGVLDDILKIFQDIEDYEKCSCVVKWKEEIKNRESY